LILTGFEEVVDFTLVELHFVGLLNEVPAEVNGKVGKVK